MAVVTKQMLKESRPEIEAALIEVGNRFGVSFKIGNGKFGEEGGVSGSFVLKILGTSEDGKSGEQVEFEKYCRIYELLPEAFGQTFQANGHEYKIAGLQTTRSKYPILAERADGKRHLFPQEVIHRVLDSKYVSESDLTRPVVY
jgi:hypothetical protein